MAQLIQVSKKLKLPLFNVRSKKFRSRGKDGYKTRDDVHVDSDGMLNEVRGFLSCSFFFFFSLS